MQWAQLLTAELSFILQGGEYGGKCMRYYKRLFFDCTYCVYAFHSIKNHLAKK